MQYCLIGATALAVHGFVRATADVDLLTLDDRVLRDDFWAGDEVTIFRGDRDDPLAGTVRRSLHDIIVGRSKAARHAVTTALLNASLGCPVATPPALVLLKLEAGSALDRIDVGELVRARKAIDGAPWLAQMPDLLKLVSGEARAAWEEIAPNE